MSTPPPVRPRPPIRNDVTFDFDSSPYVDADNIDSKSDQHQPDTNTNQIRCDSKSNTASDIEGTSNSEDNSNSSEAAQSVAPVTTPSSLSLMPINLLATLAPKLPDSTSRAPLNLLLNISIAGNTKNKSIKHKHRKSSSPNSGRGTVCDTSRLVLSSNRNKMKARGIAVSLLIRQYFKLIIGVVVATAFVNISAYVVMTVLKQRTAITTTATTTIAAAAAATNTAAVAAAVVDASTTTTTTRNTLMPDKSILPIDSGNSASSNPKAKIWNDLEAFNSGGNITNIAIRYVQSNCPCKFFPLRNEGCIIGLQTKYGSVHGSYFGYTKNRGNDEGITLAADEFIREIKVGFAQMVFEFGFSTRPALCYLQFTSNLHSFGPYSGNCAQADISTHSLASGLAYFSGHGHWCIEGLTMNYFR